MSRGSLFLLPFCLVKLVDELIRYLDKQPRAGYLKRRSSPLAFSERVEG